MLVTVCNLKGQTIKLFDTDAETTNQLIEAVGCQFHGYKTVKEVYIGFYDGIKYAKAWVY